MKSIMMMLLLLGMTFYFNTENDSGLVYINQSEDDAIVVNRGKNTCQVVSARLGIVQRKCTEYFEKFMGPTFTTESILSVIVPLSVYNSKLKGGD